MGGSDDARGRVPQRAGGVAGPGPERHGRRRRGGRDHEGRDRGRARRRDGRARARRGRPGLPQRDDVPAAEDRAERHDDPARPRPARAGAARTAGGSAKATGSASPRPTHERQLGRGARQPRRGHAPLPRRLRERGRPGPEGPRARPAALLKATAAHPRADRARESRDRRPQAEARAADPQPARALGRRGGEGRRAGEPGGGELATCSRRVGAHEADLAAGVERLPAALALDAARAARGTRARRGAPTGCARPAAAGTRARAGDG